MYVPKSGLTVGAAGGWSLCLLAGGRAGAGVVKVEVILGGDRRLVDDSGTKGAQCKFNLDCTPTSGPPLYLPPVSHALKFFKHQAWRSPSSSAE
jgi:hypothetical protein